jgi:hypothetical protein
VGGCGLVASGTGQGPVAGCCEHGNEISGSINGRGFLDYLSNFSRMTLLHGVIVSLQTVSLVIISLRTLKRCKVGSSFGDCII